MKYYYRGEPSGFKELENIEKFREGKEKFNEKIKSKREKNKAKRMRKREKIKNSLEERQEQLEKLCRVKSKKFYESKEWMYLRNKVFQKYGNVCMKCGATSRDGKTILLVDHILPRNMMPGWSLNFDNLQILCSDCVNQKVDNDFTDYRPQFNKKLK